MSPRGPHCPLLWSRDEAAGCREHIRQHYHTSHLRCAFWPSQAADVTHLTEGSQLPSFSRCDRDCMPAFSVLIHESGCKPELWAYKSKVASAFLTASAEIYMRLQSNQ
eukprot:671384-Amphidinium_carterae.1